MIKGCWGAVNKVDCAPFLLSLLQSSSPWYPYEPCISKHFTYFTNNGYFRETSKLYVRDWKIIFLDSKHKKLVHAS